MVLILFTIRQHGQEGCDPGDMIVSPDFRGKGVGARLVEQAVGLATDKGCGRVTLLTDHDNSMAHLLYHKCGFSNRIWCLQKVDGLVTESSKTDQARESAGFRTRGKVKYSAERRCKERRCQSFS